MTRDRGNSTEHRHNTDADFPSPQEIRQFLACLPVVRVADRPRVWLLFLNPGQSTWTRAYGCRAGRTSLWSAVRRVDPTISGMFHPAQGWTAVPRRTVVLQALARLPRRAGARRASRRESANAGVPAEPARLPADRRR